MKTVLAGIFILTTVNLMGQTMDTPAKTVIQLFVSTDQNDWYTVSKCFASIVLLDYSSMNGSPSSELSPTQIIENWKSILPGFESTHHQLGNFLTTENEGVAHVYTYGTASHYLNDDNGNLWIVIGSYDFELKKLDNTWKITSMKFNFKYQEGNLSLPEKAMKNLK